MYLVKLKSYLQKLLSKIISAVGFLVFDSTSGGE